MNGEWTEVSLHDLAEFRNGKAITGDKYMSNGMYPVFGSNGEIGRTNQILYKEPVVVIGRVGAYCGCVHHVPESSWITDNAIAATAKQGNDLRFLFYLFTYLDLRRTAIGSAQPLMTQGGLKAIRTCVPPLPEQRAIACILGALDDKIELNRRRNRTLEAMARAIFQSWFVDFDPVQAKAAGRTPPGLSPEIAALFPDRFEDSPLGPIPAGWRVGTVGDIVSLSRDAILPGDYANEVFDHYSIPAYDAGQNPAPESGSTIKSQKFIVTDDCVLVSKLNPKTPRVWIPEVDESRRRIASTEFVVCRPKASSGLGRAYFYCLACDKTFSEHLTSRASGTSNSHQRVRPQDFLSYEIPLPAAKLASAFKDKVEPVLDRVLLVKKESRTLAALRDELLPKLISGELRVPDAERIVGRAT